MAATTLGVLTPHAAPGPEAEWPLMSAGRVAVRVARVAAPDGTAADPGAPPTSPAELRALASPAALEGAMAGLTASPDVVAIGYASTTTGYAIGHAAEAALVRTLAEQCDVPVESASTAAVTALRALGVERLQLVHPPWFDDEMHQLGASYFAEQGYDVVASRPVDASWSPDRIVLDDVVAWAGSHVRPEAQAVLLGGNGFRVAAAVARLEELLGRPVLTANQVLLWSLLGRLRVDATVSGFGALFDVR